MQRMAEIFYLIVKFYFCQECINSKLTIIPQMLKKIFFFFINLSLKYKYKI